MSIYDAFARFYDLDTEGIDADLPFWISLARRTGGPVLEIGCGTGRVLVPLAEAGYEIVGVDISPAMLAVAREKVEAAGVSDRVKLSLVDALNLRLDRRFSLALIALNSFGHFAEVGEPERVLDRVQEHLEPGGVLALDLTNPMPGAFGETTGVLIHDYTRPGPQPGWQTVKQRSQALDPIEQVIDVSCLYDEVGPNGELRRSLASFVLRYFYRNELQLLLERAGFAREQFYGSYDLDPLVEESERLIVVAERPGRRRARGQPEMLASAQRPGASAED